MVNDRLVVEISAKRKVKKERSNREEGREKKRWRESGNEKGGVPKGDINYSRDGFI